MLNHFLTRVLDQDSFMHTNHNQSKIRDEHRNITVRNETANMETLTLFLLELSSLIVSVLPHAASFKK